MLSNQSMESKPKVTSLLKKSIYYIPPSLKHDYETIYLLFLQEVLLYMY